MNDNAEICVKCGVRRFVGHDYCQICGARTTENMKTCPKCKAVLKSAMSTQQIKNTAIKKGSSVLSKVLLVLGWICIIGSFPLILAGGGSFTLPVIGAGLVVVSRMLK